MHIGAWLEGKATAELDRSECYRAAIVLVVSALDHYVHALILEAVEGMLYGARPPSQRFATLRVRLADASSNLGSGKWAWVVSELREQHSIVTYQRPEKISDGLKWVDDRKQLWVRLGARMHLSAADLKTRLELLVDRRNRIAHEGDLDPTWGTARPLTQPDVRDALAFVTELVSSIDAECW